MTKKSRNYLINAGLIVVSMILCLASLELILRFTSYKNLLIRDKYLRYYYRSDPVKGYDIRPNVKKIRTSVDNGHVTYDIWSNELCCFDRPYNGEKQSILLVGDSFTHSYAPFENKWGTRIESLLDYRVLKCGVSGYGTKQEYLKAEEIISRIKNKPQLIIVGYFWNDLSDDYLFPDLMVIDGFLVNATKFRDRKTINPANPGEGELRYTWRDKLTGAYPLKVTELLEYYLDSHFILLDLINQAQAKYFPPKFSSPSPGDFQFLAFNQKQREKDPSIWEKHLENLRLFKKLAQDNQAELLIVIIPTNTQVYPFLTDWRNIDLEGPNKILHKFLDEERIHYLDLLPHFRKYADLRPHPSLSSEKDLYWHSNSHWSLKGENLAALLVARYILENNLIQVDEKEKKLGNLEEGLKTFH